MEAGAWVVDDYFSDATSASGVKLDSDRGGADSLLTRGGGRVGNIGSLKFSRNLDTGDQYDRPISATGATEIIVPFNSFGADSLTHHGPNRAVASFNFGSGEPVATTTPANGEICTLATPSSVPDSSRRIKLKFDWPASDYARFQCNAVVQKLVQLLNIESWRFQVLRSWAGSVNVEVELRDQDNVPDPAPISGDEVEQFLARELPAGTFADDSLLGPNVRLVEFTDSQGRVFGQSTGVGIGIIIGIVIGVLFLVALIIGIVLVVRSKRRNKSYTSTGSSSNDTLYQPLQDISPAPVAVAAPSSYASPTLRAVVMNYV